MVRLLEEINGFDRSVPHRSLGTLPTPVNSATELGNQIGIGELYVKHDDLTGDQYGGNKVRKLEFLLADAIEQDRTAVWTGGGIGSNHVLATSIYARACSSCLVKRIPPDGEGLQPCFGGRWIDVAKAIAE